VLVSNAFTVTGENAKNENGLHMQAIFVIREL